MNHIATPHPPSEAVLLAELEQSRMMIEILTQALEQIANASDVPPPGITWRDRCTVWRATASAALTAAEGG